MLKGSIAEVVFVSLVWAENSVFFLPWRLRAGSGESRQGDKYTSTQVDMSSCTPAYSAHFSTKLTFLLVIVNNDLTLVSLPVGQDCQNSVGFEEGRADSGGFWKIPGIF